jgi:hypothetical protein
MFMACSLEAFGDIFVMPGLVPGIHVFSSFAKRKDVDGRDEPGHDGAKIP